MTARILEKSIMRVMTALILALVITLVLPALLDLRVYEDGSYAGCFPGQPCRGSLWTQRDLAHHAIEEWQ